MKNGSRYLYYHIFLNGCQEKTKESISLVSVINYISLFPQKYCIIFYRKNQVFYNKIMAKRSFSRRVYRKIKKLLSPKNAEDIIKREFEDSRGNKHELNFNFRPHSPNDGGDIRLKYNQGENK